MRVSLLLAWTWVKLAGISVALCCGVIGAHAMYDYLEHIHAALAALMGNRGISSFALQRLGERLLTFAASKNRDLLQAEVLVRRWTATRLQLVSFSTAQLLVAHIPTHTTAGPLQKLVHNHADVAHHCERAGMCAECHPCE